MTVKEFARQLKIPRGVALKLAPKIPGAKQEVLGPGQLPAWVLPDTAPELVTEEMVDEAREEAAQPASPSSSGPALVSPAAPPPPEPELREEELAVKREKLAAEKIRAETARLQAEAERKKVQEELKAISSARGGVDPLLAERLGRLEQKIETAMQRPDSTATLTEALKAIAPMLTPFLERLAAPSPQPTAPALGPMELVTLAEKMKGLIGTPETNLRREIREAFREGMDVGRERAWAERGEGGESWGETIKNLAQGLSPLLPALIQATQQATPGAGSPQHALSGVVPQKGDGGGTMAAHPVFTEILGCTGRGAEETRP